MKQTAVKKAQKRRPAPEADTLAVRTDFGHRVKRDLWRNWGLYVMFIPVFVYFIVFFGGERSPLLQNPNLYRTIYIISDIWQQIGWGSTRYLNE